jgi:hypothetical protein
MGLWVDFISFVLGCKILKFMILETYGKIETDINHRILTGPLTKTQL